MPEERREEMRTRMSIESALRETHPLPEIEDDRLGDCLKILNTKLDSILSMLTMQGAEYCDLRSLPVNISAGGIGIPLGEEFRPGDVVEIKLVFPTLAHVVFHIFGEVVNIEDEGGKLVTSIEFYDMDDEIRDYIAKFVFERQRELLRRKRRQ